MPVTWLDCEKLMTPAHALVWVRGMESRNAFA